MDKNTVAEAGGRIRQRCRDNWPPISISRLARRLDMDATALSRILDGDRNVPEGMYEKVAQILGCELSDILSSEIAA